MMLLKASVAKVEGHCSFPTLASKPGSQGDACASEASKKDNTTTSHVIRIHITREIWLQKAMNTM
jgi:hypothetical protein